MKTTAIIKSIGLSIVMVGTALSFQGCNDYLEVEPNHIAGEEQQWNTLEDTRSALMGVYGLMRSALAENNTAWVAGELRLGDFTSATRRDLKQIIDNDLRINNSLVNSVADWNRFYRVVNAASVFIEKAPLIGDKDMSYSKDNLKYDIAQARALRALAYFYMVKMWGDVPLIVSSFDNGAFPSVPRTDKDEILSFVTTELKASAEVLPLQYGSSNNQYYRQEPSYWQGKLLNRLSVYAILSQVAAWRGNYADVESYTSYIMANARQIGLEADYYATVDRIISPKGLFSGTSSESSAYRLVAFNFLHSAGESTQSGHFEMWTLASPYIPKSKPDLYVTKDNLSEIYSDPSDLRYGIDPATESYRATSYFDMFSTYPIFKKINVVQDGNNEDGNFAVFGSSILLSRMEDVVLMRCEALAMLNKPAESLALLNEMRTKRGLSMLSYKKHLNSDIKALVNEIFAERNREFIGEGYRWFDRIRRQKLLGDDLEMQRLIDTDGIYWPVSTEVMKNNLTITQNPYWN